MKKFVLSLLGFIWLLPITILVWLFYVLPLWCLGYIRYIGMIDSFVWHFEVNQDKSNWYTKLWRDWAGWSGPCVIITKKSNNLFFNARTIVHELRHCHQQFAFGPFFYLAYILTSAFIWLFQKNKHAYHDNPFERDARAKAFQPVDIPRQMWMHGPDDRWPWW